MNTLQIVSIKERDTVTRTKYSTLIPSQIYIGGENDAQDMVDVAHCDVIIDLRLEADAPAFYSQTAQWVHIGLKDHISGQEEQVKKAIQNIIHFYHRGKIIGIHCASGICRTATVATGVLIDLGLCRKMKEALEYVEMSRSQTCIHPSLRQTLQNLYR